MLLTTYHFFRIYIQPSLLTEWIDRWTTNQPSKKVLLRNKSKLPVSSCLKYTHFLPGVNRNPAPSIRVYQTQSSVPTVYIGRGEREVTHHPRKCQFLPAIFVPLSSHSLLLSRVHMCKLRPPHESTQLPKQEIWTHYAISHITHHQLQKDDLRFMMQKDPKPL